MLFRDVIDLITFEESTNENGFSTQTETERTTVFSNKKSVRGNEYYLASQNGIKLEAMFVVRTADYQSQRYMDFENKRYEIVRTYDKGEFIELICQAFVV
jgi:SPP1 family predicted phage head-tail adaptor